MPWTPQRQVAFIEALADTGSVSRAAAQVNMSTEGAYAFRRQPGAAGFAQAWEAALDMGLLRLKDEAFERALHGQLHPVIVGGKLLGYRRKRNDRLIMFVLRHYGLDAAGRRVTVSTFGQGCAEARDRGAAPQDAPAPTDAAQQPAQPSTEPSPALPAPDPLADFTGVELDEEAQAQIYAVLEACAARARTADPGEDTDAPFVPVGAMPPDHPDAIEPPAYMTDSTGSGREGDEDWRMLDLPDRREELAALAAQVAADKASGASRRRAADPGPTAEEVRAEANRRAFERRRMDAYMASGVDSNGWEKFMREYRE